MTKTIICNWGASEQGKSATLRLVWDRLKEKNKNAKNKVFIDDGDIKISIELDNTKVGIESQGDPNSRLTREELSDLLDCDIIICTCRTRGETPGVINRVAQNNGYRIIWVTNHRLNTQDSGVINSLNNLSADGIVELTERIIRNEV
ncbi:hypothetical protein [Flavobacterium coralii]|uniref:hypothetical protein n=1 Tax=Flavobacterium coralii TaxID=2838017 RepID=UPI000C370B67|nr:hypothetical protein [Flavobacterium sp.]|tara:strand:- start:102 stop:542 length:441 start_codon:yes stop_codon:yes gene_type:complete